MQCTPEQIAEKRRLAQQKLAQKRLMIENVNAKSPEVFLTSNNRNSFFNKPGDYCNNHNSVRSPKQFTFKPYDKQKTTPQQSNQTKTNVITGTCYLISECRFAVELTGFSTPAINIFKTIPSKSYSKYSGLNIFTQIALKLM